MRKLPVWHKTTFYCFASSLRQVIDGRALANGMIELLALNAINPGLSKNREPGTFRLGRYKIKAINDNALSWQTVGLNNRVAGGQCFLESGILLLGPKIHESDPGARKSFYAKLKVLPQWNKTLAWGYADAIRRCRESTYNKISAATAWDSGPDKSFKSERISFTLTPRWQSEKRPKPSRFREARLKTEWKYLGEFALQTRAFGYSGLRMSTLLLKKWIHRVAKRWKLFKPHS